MLRMGNQFQKAEIFAGELSWGLKEIIFTNLELGPGRFRKKSLSSFLGLFA